MTPRSVTAPNLRLLHIRVWAAEVANRNTATLISVSAGWKFGVLTADLEWRTK